MENTQTKQEINNQIIKNLIKIIVINSTSSQELNKMQEDLQKSCEVLKDFKDIGFDFKTNQEYVLDKKKYLDYFLIKENEGWIKILEK